MSRLLDGVIDTRPLRHNAPFRRLWASTFVSGLGGQLASVAVLYQAWRITDDPVAVGAVGAVRVIPLVVFGIVGGSLADAFDRRKLVLVTVTGQLLFAVLLAAQALAGLRSLWLLLALIAVQTAFGATGAPASRTFGARLLPTEQVASGVALMHLSFQVTLLVGPAVAGFVIGLWGVDACYVVDAVTFLVALYGVARLPSLRPLETAAPPGPRAIWEGWRFIAGRPVLVGAFLTDVLATVLTMPISMFPVVNAERFGDRPEVLGFFFSAIAVGGIAAAAASGMVTRARHPGVVMLVSVCVWGAGLGAFGLVEPLWLTLACLAVAGAADTISVISRGAIVQLATPDSHRGRVSAVEHVVGVAGPELGNFRGGLVAGWTSATFALVSGGVLCLLGAAWLAVANRPLRRFSVSSDTCAK